MTLDDIFVESVATCAHSVAGNRTGLFSGGEVTPQMLKRILPAASEKIEKIKLNRNKRTFVDSIPILNLNNDEAK